MNDSIPKYQHPLTWKAHITLFPELFPYRTVSSRTLSNIEIRTMRDWCTETYGPGFGTGSMTGANWENKHDVFSFRHEKDMAMFILAFTGYSGFLENTRIFFQSDDVLVFHSCPISSKIP